MDNGLGEVAQALSRAKEDIAHLPPEQIAASILEKEQRIAEIMQRIQKLLAQSTDS